MLADRLGRSQTGAGDGPCTLQVPPTSLQILMRKLIVVGLCSVHDAMNEDQRKPKRQDTHRNPRQDEKGRDGLEHGAAPRPVSVRGGRVVDRSARR
jgi:hypothetical protein